MHVAYLAALLPTIIAGEVLGDLPLYRYWAQLSLETGLWQGIHTEWVYPIGATLPIVGANLLGPQLYQLLWLLLTTVLNWLAVWVLTDRLRNTAAFPAAWWWMLLNLALSPVALLRLEGVSSPLVVIGLVLLARRPIVATIVLSIATWIKVWPAAVLLAIVGASPRRILVIITGAATTAVIVLATWAGGGLNHIMSFITMQSDRQLQLEAPITTPWVWLAALHQPGTTSYHNYEISTREVMGPGTSLAVHAMTPLMFIAIALIFVMMMFALRHKAETSQLIFMGSLALVTAFIVFNKVGSPQYILWITPVIAVGLIGHAREWRFAAWLVAIIGVLTTLIYPIFYMPLIAGNLWVTTLLTVRNLLLVVLLCWAIGKLWNMSMKPPRTAAYPAGVSV
nr:glycosyltransferase 87 family protein [Lysinibacter cavernae]